jgi:formylglycine-generating enzyme required for sulfatase activity
MTDIPQQRGLFLPNRIMPSLLSPHFCIGTLAALSLAVCSSVVMADDKLESYLRDPNSMASTPAEMKPYKQWIRDTDIVFEMVPIPGGEFVMGSPPGEKGRSDDEGPQHKVRIEPFWMGKCEVTWDEYDTWRLRLDQQRRALAGRSADDVDKKADATTRPTKEYTDMTFGMGHDGFPATGLTQLNAKSYCVWLTERTGQYYRLPTEAEWEYACRAGTTTAYSFGDDESKLDDYAWHTGNSDDNYQKVGLKKPNPWGLHDMHGNVSEWTLDRYEADFYSKLPKDTAAIFPLCVPNEEEYPRVFRGGSWMDEADRLRSAARFASDEELKSQDPQLPQSRWYLTDATHLGFRVIRPLKPATPEEIQKYVLYPDTPKALEDRIKREGKN